MLNLTQICRSRGMTLTDLADAVGRKRDTVKKWGRERRIPAEAVPEVVRALGGAVRPEDLRPDVFGDPPTPPTDPQHGRAA